MTHSLNFTQSACQTSLLILDSLQRVHEVRPTGGQCEEQLLDQCISVCKCLAWRRWHQVDQTQIRGQIQGAVVSEQVPAKMRRAVECQTHSTRQKERGKLLVGFLTKQLQRLTPLGLRSYRFLIKDTHQKDTQVEQTSTLPVYLRSIREKCLIM